MTVAGLRERKKEKTREALVRAAIGRFAQHGFDLVTVEEIAAECDVAPRTFFRYFASKEDVLFAESDLHVGRVLASLDEQDGSTPPFQALETAMHVVAGAYALERDALRLRHRIVTATPSLRTRAAERQQRWESDIIDELVSSGRARLLSDLELRLVVASAITALRVAVEAWVAGDDAADLEILLQLAFDRLRHGFAGAGVASPRA